MAIVEQRVAVLQEPAWSGRSVREVCVRHGISPDTFYAWRRRYAQEGLEGLVPRSRRAQHLPGSASAEVEDWILTLRKDHGWGPRKIRDALRRDGLPVPATSTVQQALARRGVLLTPRRRRTPARVEGTRLSGRPATSCGRSTAPSTIWPMAPRTGCWTWLMTTPGSACRPGWGPR